MGNFRVVKINNYSQIDPKYSANHINCLYKFHINHEISPHKITCYDICASLLVFFVGNLKYENSELKALCNEVRRCAEEVKKLTQEFCEIKKEVEATKREVDNAQYFCTENYVFE